MPKEEMIEEDRPKQAERVSAFLARIQAYEYVHNILEEKEEKPSFDDFKDFLVRMNGMARGIPIRKRSADGMHVGLKGFVDSVNVPKHEDKEDLLKYAYDHLEEVEKDDIKYLMPAVINAVHFFNDGNGRTSRVMYHLFEKHSSEEEFEKELKLALGEDGRWDTPDINPGLIGFEIQRIVLQRYGWEFDEEHKLRATSLGSIKAFVATAETRELDKNHPNYPLAQDFFGIYQNDSEYLLTAFHRVVGDDRAAEMLTDKYEVKGCVSPLKMLEKITAEEWQKIMEGYFEIKKEHVKALVDCFRRPDEYKSSRNNKMYLKDYFIKKIKKNYEQNSALK